MPYTCPPPTQNPQLNARNRLRAIREARYGPLRVTLFGKLHELRGRAAERYWQILAREWGVDYSEAFHRRCRSCEFYDTTSKMVTCGGASRDGEVGYCHAWRFTCAAKRVCLSWSPRR